ARSERLRKEAERRERRRAGAALVWDNRETQMAGPNAVEPLLFPLIGRSCGAEGVLLNKDLAVRSTAVARDFHPYLLGALPCRLLDFVHEPRDRLRLVKFHDNVLERIRTRTDPTRGLGA